MRTTRVRSYWLGPSLAGALAVCAGAAPAEAQSSDDALAAPATEASGQRTAETGAFLPFSYSARNDTQRAFVTMTGGYDVARGGARFDSAVEARIAGPLSIRAGGGYVGPSGTFRPSFALKVQALRQGRHGVDMAIYGGYEGQGYNTVPAATALVAVSRTVGRTTLLGNLGYGLGLEEGEHYGDVRLAALTRVLPNLHIGLDSRGRLDLERDSDEPEGEPDWELLAGPLATYSLGRFVVSAGAGFSAIRFRLSEDSKAGVLGHMGLGAVF